MAKGYWIARIDVHNMEGYKDYVAQNGGGVQEIRREVSWCAAASSKPGKARRARATWCSNSRTTRPRWPATIRRNTTHLVALRSPHSEGDLVIIEGYDGPQP